MWVVVKELRYGRHEIIDDSRILRLSKVLRVGYLYPFTPVKCHNIDLEHLRKMEFSSSEYLNLLTQERHLCVVLYVPESEGYAESYLFLTMRSRKARESLIVDEAGECVHCLIEYLCGEQPNKKRKVQDTP